VLTGFLSQDSSRVMNNVFCPCSYVAENPDFGKDEDSGNEGIDYDEDGNPIAPKKSKVCNNNAAIWS